MPGPIPVLRFKEVDLKKHREEAFRIIFAGISRGRISRSSRRMKE
jgi:hypothetical protein